MQEIWFRLNNVEVRLSLIEFALVIGLIFKHNTEVSNYIDCAERPQLKEEYFLRIRKLLTYLDIKNIVKTQIWRDNGEDVMKFVALYLAFSKTINVGQ